MTDDQIVQLFLERSESAVVQTKTKYGKYCFSVAMNILNNNEDSEECVNDTYLKAWNCIPPHKPSILSAFLGKITRRLALDMYRRKNSEKRGGRVIEVSEELADCIVFSNDIEKHIDEIVLTEIINEFLKQISEEQRRIFIRRYWHFCSIKEIATENSMSQSKVKMSLLRSRNQLKTILEKEYF